MPADRWLYSLLSSTSCALFGFVFDRDSDLDGFLPPFAISGGRWAEGCVAFPWYSVLSCDPTAFVSMATASIRGLLIGLVGEEAIVLGHRVKESRVIASMSRELREIGARLIVGPEGHGLSTGTTLSELVDGGSRRMWLRAGRNA